MTHEKDLEKEIHQILKRSSEVRNYNTKLQDKYEKQEKDFNRERDKWDRVRKKWSEKLGEVVTENQNLQFENASKAISLTNSKSEIDIKSKEITTLRSMKKILEGRLTSAQNDAVSTQEEILKKESEITSLKSELVNLKDELALKISELGCMKSEDVSRSVIGGVDEKNITKSDDISAVSEPNKNLSKYFIRGKNMDETKKINNNIPAYTNNEITKLPKDDTEILSKVSDETNISETSKDIMLDTSIKPDISPIISENMTPYLAQWENYTSSPIKSHPQISVGGIEAIPIVASTLMSPLSAYIFLTLLIIAVMWFVILRRTWGLERKSDQLRNMWIG
ncbi:7282_t:CDS:1 [Paraglomus brasilianum]|uniref:7282_t:CDS:1 n=1 Tax=Paraglomus brasilianum TaxID=144538 RepID=A0A9N9E0X7_9GLOM|nr:7282_t:CDS:1 [Paraglomus brasilianum]